ncbi:MAG: hypothetical protein NTW53_00720 [Burkholderiales bacterium]|nr:hypothetical protein [Burkholderiales bacterium]
MSALPLRVSGATDLRGLSSGAYLSLLVIFAGLNFVRVGSVGIGVFVEAALVFGVMVTLGLAALLRLRVRLAGSDLLAVGLWLACALLAMVRADFTLASSILIAVCSWLFLRRPCVNPRFARRYLYLWPCLVGYAFHLVYTAVPSLVVLEEAGGKYVSIAGLQLLRFEGATLNANAYGLYIAVVLYGMREAGVRGPWLWPGYLSLLLTFSYSSIAGLLFLSFCRGSGALSRGLIVGLLIAIVSVYSVIKGWGLAESIRILKYGYYSAALVGEPVHAILSGGMNRGSHDWIVLTDNAWLTLLYDHGLVMVAAYFLAFYLILRHDKPLLVLFLLANAIVDLQYFWLANLAFLLVSERRRPSAALIKGAM